MLLRRIIFYIIFLLFITSAIQQLGFHITALLGATGIITVALGIASQTSMSNIISGMFIIGEKPFEIGDTIKVNELQGEVLSIDYLSVKIRTNDNMMARIPNEMLVKSPIVNISYFPIRRVDLTFTITYKTNIETLKKILLDIAAQNALCLDEPEPCVSVVRMTDNGIQMQFSVWVKKDKFNELKSTIQAEISAALMAGNIDMSLPTYAFHMDINKPLPIKIIAEDN